MLFYILFILCAFLLLVLCHVYPNKNKLFLWSVFAIIVCFGGLRNNVGADFDEYVQWYLLKTRDGDFEYGYLGLMNIFRALNLGYNSLFFFVSFLTYLFLFLGVRKYTLHQNIAIGIFLLIPSMFLLSLNTIRQCLAVSICFYAFYYLINKKYWVFCILMLVALSLHNTVIVPFVLFVLVFKFADRIKAAHILIMLIVSFLLSKLEFVQVFSSLFKDVRYAYYFLTPRVPVSLLKMVVLNGVAVFVLFHFEKMKNKYPNQKYLLVLYFLSVIITNFLSYYSELTRLGYYFKIFEIIVVADLIFLGNKKYRMGLLTFFAVYYFAAFVYTLKMDLEKDYKCKLIPYKNILF